MDKISNIITDFYIKNDYVSKDKREIYKYGFKLIIADIINFFIVMSFGIVLKSFIESMIFLLTLCSLRQFSGGFHAKTFWLCRLSMIITFLCVLIINYVLLHIVDYNIMLVFAIDIISMILVAVLAPVKHPNKSLTDQQKKKNKLMAIITSAVLSAVSVILVIVNNNKGVIISITLAAVVVLMLIGIAVQKGGDDNV